MLTTEGLACSTTATMWVRRSEVAAAGWLAAATGHTRPTGGGIPPYARKYALGPALAAWSTVVDRPPERMAIASVYGEGADGLDPYVRCLIKGPSYSVASSEQLLPGRVAPS